MDPSETEPIPVRADEPLSGLVAFMPWLRLKEPVAVAEVEFVPFHDDAGNVYPSLVDVRQMFSLILSSYVDREGKPIDNAVVATLAGRGWRVTDADHETVTAAAGLLFFACWAGNEQFSQFSGRYVSSVPFRLVLATVGKFTDGRRGEFYAREDVNGVLIVVRFVWTVR